MHKSTQEDSRIHNSRLVLSTIYNRGETSRAEVARLTGLTRTTVSEIVGRFIEESLVTETGVSPSRGGKPAILLQVNDDARHLIGIDLANSEFRGAVVNLRGRVIRRLYLPVDELDGQAAVALVYSLIEQLMAHVERPILGIGIGTPGLMDPQKGIVRQAVNLDWHELPLGDLLRQRFNLPIYIANDSQAAALGEFTFANPGRHNNLVIIKVGRGTSAGIVLDGKLFHGDNSGAGEIGHVKVVEAGAACRCGNTGCLETVVSSRALLRQAREIARQDPDWMLNRLAPAPEMFTTETLLLAYASGDPRVIEMVAQAGRHLAVAVAYLASTLNINHIVIAGSLSRFGEGLVQPVREQVQKGTLASLARQTEITVSSLGGDIVILGAASLLLSNELGLNLTGTGPQQ
jgi:glucokinase-like ROK family protein